MDTCVDVKKVELFLPPGFDIYELSELSPEELELVLTIGLNAYKTAKNDMNNEFNRETIERIVEELNVKFEEEMESLKNKTFGLEAVVEMQKENVKMMQMEQEEEIQKRIMICKSAYDSIVQTYVKERDTLRTQIENMERERDQNQNISRSFKTEIENKIQMEAMNLVKRELDTMQKILAEKEKQIENYKQMFEKSMLKIENVTQKRDVASIGKIGENQFKSLALNVFRDFEGFELVDVYSIGGMGDFHMQFKDMTILVDSKLYSNKVNSTSREKIKRDLLKNEHIHFAWLVSMDTMVDRFDKAPFMFEWVSSNKCICYINRLLKQEEPGELLRAVWYSCKTMNQLIVNEELEQSELGKMKENEMKMRDILSKLVKNNRERDTLLNQMKQNYDKTDELMREMLNTETNKWATTNYHGVVVDWWNKNLEECTGGDKIKSTLIWSQFKKDMGNEIGDMGCNTFKDILCSFLGEGKILKPKVKNSALEIINYRWRDGVEIQEGAKRKPGREAPSI